MVLSTGSDKLKVTQRLRSSHVKGAHMPKLAEGFVDKIVVPNGKRDVLVFDNGHDKAVRGSASGSIATTGQATSSNIPSTDSHDDKP